MVFMLLLGNHLAIADSPSAGCSEPEPLSPYDERNAEAEWVDGGDGPALYLRAPKWQGLRYTVETRLSFGPIDLWFTSESVAIEPLEEVVIPLEFGPESRLDPLADLYVTAVLTRVYIEDEATYRLLAVKLPPRFLAWPDGEFGGVAFWTKDEVELFAPHGTLDQAVQQELDLEDPEMWIAPPVADRGRDAEGGEPRSEDEVNGAGNLPEGGEQ